jgi:hypothetical protein
VAARSTHVVFTNHTDQPLGKLGQDLPHGVWTNGVEPPFTIAPGEKVEWESESDGFMTGTEGSTRYGIGTTGGELTVHWDNPFVGSNTYDERVSPGWTVLRSGGRGENATIQYDFERSGWHVTPFRPSQHGFKFANSWPPGTTARTIDLGITTIGIGDASNGLCGGMVFAALDYYLAGTTIPQQTTAPPGEGDPLFDYFVSRLIDSFNIPSFPVRLFGVMAPTYPDTDQGILEPVGLMDGRSAIMVREAWPQIKAWVDAGVPMPICILKVKDSLWPGDLGKNHQILVWGYYLDGTALTLAVYDPNDPGNDGAMLSLDISRTDVVITVGTTPASLGPVYTFMTMAYTKTQPPAIP